jgi:hypothetical protein
LETGFDKADWSCRKDVYTKFSVTCPAMDAFARLHAARIARGKHVWRDATQQAR